MQNVGIHALVVLISYLAAVGFSFRAIRAIKIENFIKPNHIFEAQIFLMFTAISMGYLVGSFIVALIDNSMALKMLFF